MKTYNRLKNQIVAFDNLLGALKKARKGKKKYKSQWSLTCIVAEDSYSIVGFELKQNCLEGSYLVPRNLDSCPPGSLENPYFCSKSTKIAAF